MECRRCERAVYRDLDGEYACIVHGTQYYPIVTPEVALAEVSYKRGEPRVKVNEQLAFRDFQVMGR